MRGFNYKKAVQALNLLAIKEGGTLNKMKAIKLVWLSDRLHLLNHGRTITGDSYFAMKHGPVPSYTRDFLESNNWSLADEELKFSQEYFKIIDKYSFQTIKSFDSSVFSNSDILVLEEVYNKYGKFDQYQLRDISHEFPEWKKHESVIESGISSRVEMNLLDFFVDAPAKIDYLAVEHDIKSISKEIFLESLEIAKIFE